MATISPPQSSLTPPSSSHGKTSSGRGGDWDYSVPIDATHPAPQKRPNHGAPRKASTSSKQSIPIGDVNGPILTPKANGYPSPDNSTNENASDDHTTPSDNYLLAPRAANRRDSAVSSNHDGDSLFDLYGGRMSMMSGVSVGGSGGSVYGNGYSSRYVQDDPDPESSKWIHRDKLAKIEGNEAADYLYDVESSRWIHKDKLERIEIQELQRAGLTVEQIPQAPHAGDESVEHGDGRGTVEDNNNHQIDPHDLRTPEEQAADALAAANTPHKQFRRHPSYSRIPVATASPLPIPQQYIERSTPAPRKPMTPSEEDGRVSISLPGSRKRSHSASSAFLLEDSPSHGTPTPGSKINNPKGRTAMSPGNRSSTSRQGSLTQKQRTRSNPQLHRPGTSASHATHGSGGTQGSAGKTPEGPPPWALQSYKPDPSLPPDQQIIPTHARRMQQEQWERDGVYASVYDRDLRPLKVGDDGHPDTPNKRQSVSQQGNDEWPLKSPAPVPEASPPTDGGYSTIPKVNGQTDLNRPPPQIQRVPETNDDKEKKKKFCCCIMM